MYSKYKEMPVLSRSDKSTKMIIELLVMINEKLDALLVAKEPQIIEETEVKEVAQEPLKNKTKKELIKLAKELKIDINPRDKKEVIIEALTKQG